MVDLKRIGKVLERLGLKLEKAGAKKGPKTGHKRAKKRR